MGKYYKWEKLQVMQMEKYLETNRKLEIQLILFLLDVCILSEGERGRNLDPCQIDNFVSSLSSPPRIARISPS